MKRKTLYDFNSVQLTFNQCFFNRIQYKTEHNLYSTRLDKVYRMKSSTRSVHPTRHGVCVLTETQPKFNTAWRNETRHRLYKMKSSTLTLYTFTLYTFSTLRFLYLTLFSSYNCTLYTFQGMKGQKRSEHSSTLAVDRALVCRTISAVKSFDKNRTLERERQTVADSFRCFFFRERFPANLSRATHPGRLTAMMMKFVFNIAAMTWMMSDSRIWAQYQTTMRQA